ncbi:hypothetical protein HDU67_009201, partial [Dinochytrium kinnereticum]
MNLSKSATTSHLFELLETLTVGTAEATRVIASSLVSGLSGDSRGKRVGRLELVRGVGATLDLALMMMIKVPVSLTHTLRFTTVTPRLPTTEPIVIDIPITVLPPGPELELPASTVSQEARLEERWRSGGGWFDVERVDWAVLNSSSSSSSMSVRQGSTPPLVPPRSEDSGAVRLELNRWREGEVGGHELKVFFLDVEPDDEVGGAAELFAEEEEEEKGKEGGGDKKHGWSLLPFSIVQATSKPPPPPPSSTSSFILVIHTTRHDLSLRITKDAIPSSRWFSSSSSPSPQESRVLLPDASLEITVRLPGDQPGRWFVGVLLNALLPGGVKAGFRIGVVPPKWLIRAEEAVRWDGFWVECGGRRGGTDFDNTPLYASRLKITPTSLHPGMATPTLTTIPYDGTGHHPTPSTPHDILTPIRDATWLTQKTRTTLHPNALIAGYESSGERLYLARASVRRDGRSAVVPGKAGTHIGGCNVVVGGREVRVLPFEVLVLGGSFVALLDRLGLGDGDDDDGLSPPLPPSSSSSSSSSVIDDEDCWIPLTSPTSIPVTAWRVGVDLNGDPLYVARTVIDGVTEIGKVGPHLPGPMFAVNGTEVTVVGGVVEVLKRPFGSARWVFCEGGEIPEGAFEGRCGERGFVGRGRIRRGVLDR